MGWSRCRVETGSDHLGHVLSGHIRFIMYLGLTQILHGFTSRVNKLLITCIDNGIWTEPINCAQNVGCCARLCFY